MSNLTVKFLHKEYTIPTDVITYVGLVDFTNGIRDNLVSAFNKLISIDVAMIENDDFMLSVINEQASKFISKLLNNEIYDKTANDYLQDNKGYKLFLDTKKKVLRQILSIEKEKLEVYSSGVQDAIYKKDSSVTGLDFGILSGSFVNHMIYAYMDASKQTKQEQEALKIYNKEIAELDKVAESYDQKEKSYILNNVIPAMNTVFTYFSYELLDRYVSDLIRVGKFDKAALDYINLERSNDLLKNLDLSDNKKAIIENAFVACPFNIAVYMQAMKYDLLDYASFQTAQSFKQDEPILSFLEENLCEVSYPSKFNINYHCVDLLAIFTSTDSTEILKPHTGQYVTGIFEAYSRIANMLSDNKQCKKVIRDLTDTTILSGDIISKGTAQSYVNSIVLTSVWEQLVNKCGHSDLLDRIKALVPENVRVHNKADIDNYFIDRLTDSFEKARQSIVAEINAKTETEEKRRIEQEKQKAEQERIRKEKTARRKVVIKKGFKTSTIVVSLVAVLIIAVSLVSLFINNVITPANRYNNAIALMESGDWLKARDILLLLEDYKDSENLLEQCNDEIIKYQYECAVQMMKGEKYADAINAFEELNGYKDSEALQLESTYKYALYLIDNKDFSKALELLDIVKDDRDVTDEINKATYGKAIQLLESKKYEEAAGLFNSLKGYEDATERANESYYKWAIDKMNNKSFLDAVVVFEKLGNYKDSLEKVKECRYISAKDYVDSYDYDAAKNQFTMISGYKDSDTYVKLIDNIISKIYYNDEYRGTHYIWVVSRIDTKSCTEKLNFYECRDDIGIDDEFVDYYQGHNVQWKSSGNNVYASSNGEAVENGYTLYNLSAGRNILTSQFISKNNEAGVVDTYKLMPDGRAQYIKEEWVSYLEENESDNAWKIAEATIDIIDDSGNVEKTEEGIVFHINKLKWFMPTGWDAKLNADATAALVTFSEGEYWGETDRIYISYEGQYSNLTEYMNKNKTNGTFSRISVEGCSEAYICYEALLDEYDFESNTTYVICKGSVFKVSYVADDGWYNDTQVNDALLGADFSSYSYE